MNKSTTTTTPAEVAAIAAKLTTKGREFMRAVGAGEFSFFDEGIVENSGSWGSCLSEEHFASVRSASGVMGATAKLGLWTVSEDQSGDIDAGAWWALTAEGAAVALYLAADATPLPADEPVAAEPTTATVERPWTGSYSIVMAPVTELLAEALGGLTVTTEFRTEMLRVCHLAGDRAEQLVALLADLEPLSLAALRDWQKANVDARRDLTDMQKYLQHRAFLQGFGEAVAARIAGDQLRNGKADAARLLAGGEADVPALRAGRAAGKAVEVAA
ncbi:hypothetical protein [Nocardioides halotolerans]|uniref:hypothetical protein n=1 Tax=Nocardioides halotolerans TaxID=433660 RepID=UPI0004041FBF|nr:hypothetical protein [Nocardioides halotolerans]